MFSTAFTASNESELTVLFSPLYLCVHIESRASRVSTFNIRLRTCGSHDPENSLSYTLCSACCDTQWITFTAASVLCSFYWDNWQTAEKFPLGVEQHSHLIAERRLIAQDETVRISSFCSLALSCFLCRLSRTAGLVQSQRFIQCHQLFSVNNAAHRKTTTWKVCSVIHLFLIKSNSEYDEGKNTGAASTVLKVFMPKTLVNTAQCKCCFSITLNQCEYIK